MLTIRGQRQAYCDGISRRDFLRIGGLGAGTLALPDLLRLRAQAGQAKSAKSVIMLCLPGGPSHLDMYDMKPDAPDDVRGEFRSIATKIAGLDVCEHLPGHAALADKLAIVRNMHFTQPDHQLHEVYTGFPTAAGRPAFGSVVSRLRGRHGVLPPYVSLALSDHPRTVAKAEVPTYAGLSHGPFEPTLEGLGNLTTSAELTLDRLEDRQSLRAAFDRLRRAIDLRGNMAGLDAFHAQAFEMISSPAVREAFDLGREPRQLREQYGSDVKLQYNYQFGHTWFGTKFLLARRLVEAGVPVVTLAMSGWDHHGNLNGVRGTLFERSREQLPLYDRSLCALVNDLYDRGLDRDVLVLVWGEFGRTPRVNKYGGRDHWPSAGFALFSGGGLKLGQVIGRTDASGERPVGKAYGPQNVLAMVYRHLGIDPAVTLTNFSGRPVSLLDDHQPIAEL